MSDTDYNQIRSFSHFSDWCWHQASLSPEARLTVEALLDTVNTSDCETANEELSSLTELTLYDAHISDLSPLQSLTNLTELELFRNEVSDLSPLQSLSRLTTLSISSSQIKDLSPLQFLTNLIALSVHGNQITDLESLQSLTKLTKFELFNSQIAELKPLQSLVNLTELELVNNQIANLAPLQFLINLKTLCLFNYRGYQIKDISLLKSLTSLTNLDLSHNQISDLSPLQFLTNLTKLNLSNNQISDLSPLQSLTKLTNLCLDCNQIADLKPLQSLTHLSVLRLGSNKINDLSPLKTLTNLTFLYLDGNPIDNLNSVQSLSNLTIKVRDQEPVNISFENWIKYIFDHSVTIPAWYQDSYDDWLVSMPPAVTVKYLTRTFENTKEICQQFSDAQLEQGLCYLVNNSCSNHLLAILDQSVPWPDRQRCIRSIFTLFEQCFAKKCSPQLSPLDQPLAEQEQGVDSHETNPLNSLCYMWWDIFPYWGNPEDTDQRYVDEEFFQVMEQIMHLDADACRESALHGLGHWWHPAYENKIAATIEQFLANNPSIQPELEKYALQALIGQVL
ncbi:leucine-rich repeat domain-containing protein [Lyngbya aestuarii]|uniref:leucine-rich repeat domain-containing protein n=1 Tax=Lyngbya aestuarii TaxID=118322 RepID=UPI00403D666E